LSVSNEAISHYIHALRGHDRENAYHRLIELGADIIPQLVTSYALDVNISFRATLLKIAWRTESPRAIPFLAEALDDGEPGIWKEALDGLVALGSQSALDVVRDARVRANAEKSEWLSEAVEQMTKAISNSGNDG
jgi:hypothetical protein